MATTTERYQTYADFWPFYLAEHGKPATRGLHYFGTTLAIACLVLGAAVNPWWLLAAPVAGYFFAWIAHFFVEHNRPATFTYPAWSLVSDFRMFFLWIAGRMPDELRRHGLG
ncbi:MAG: DUF962 domain-containing protein [Hyphomicrobiales bacterium]|nr:DUF962 domain-containing protein [Hyphomicrobiales bacterium]